MKLISISKNPLGTTLAVIHWIIAIIALLNIQVDKFDDIQPSGEIAIFVLLILFVLDLPAIIPLAILFLPVYFFSSFYFVLVAIGCFFIINLQWLIVGRKIYSFFYKEDQILTLNI